MFDTNRIERLGKSTAEQIRKSGLPIDITDHHEYDPVEAAKFGREINIDPSYESTCGILAARLHIGGKLRRAQKTIRPLLTGIMTDTGGLSYGKTTARTLSFVQGLVSDLEHFEPGFSFEKFRKSLFFAKRNFEIVRNEYAILSRAQFDGDGFLVIDAGIDWYKDEPAYIGQMYQSAAPKITLTTWVKEGGLFFTLKSEGEYLDMSSIAKQFGGGGHKVIAGGNCPLNKRGELIAALKALLTS